MRLAVHVCVSVLRFEHLELRCFKYVFGEVFGHVFVGVCSILCCCCLVWVLDKRSP